MSEETKPKLPIEMSMSLHLDQELVKLADKLDRLGLQGEANQIDTAIVKLAAKKDRKIGLLQETVDNHRQLMEGYQKALDKLRREQVRIIKTSKEELDTPSMGPLRDTLRDLAFAESAVILHQMYFDDVYDSRPYDIEDTKFLFPFLKDKYLPGRNRFLDAIRRTAHVSRSGWVLINYCLSTDSIYVDVVDLHDMGIVPTSVPIAALDCWEHAYLQDFGLDKEAYLDWWIEKMDWRGPEKRLKRLIKAIK